jgi:hypothetical protein
MYAMPVYSGYTVEPDKKICPVCLLINNIYAEACWSPSCYQPFLMPYVVGHIVEWR